MLRHRPDWETGGGIALNLGQKTDMYIHKLQICNMSPISLYNNKGVKGNTWEGKGMVFMKNSLCFYLSFPPHPPPLDTGKYYHMK